MFKKGQAAMEFLMTYGWAILVVLIAIGALAYFGVLNPSRFLPESCTIGPGFGCDQFQILASGNGIVIVRNGAGETFNNINLTIGTTNAAVCNVSPGACDNWGEGAQMAFNFSGLAAGTAGSKYSQDIVLQYTTTDGINHKKTGKLTTKYE